MVIAVNEDESKFFAALEERGEASVKADIETAHFGGRAPLARKWLHLKDEERAIERDKQAIRSIEAAERSAAASELAATATRDAARWAMWAALISLVATVVGFAIALYKGELPNPFA